MQNDQEPINRFLAKYYLRILRSDNVDVLNGNSTVEVVTNHLLAVASHDTLTWGEVLGSEDCRCDNEGYVRCVYVTSLEVATTLVTNKYLVAGEVGILVDCETVAKSTDLLSTKSHGFPTWPSPSML